MFRRSGFTLIELLVVIAIIAILAAILFPVFARARAKAQQTTDLSNVKELTLSTLMYCSDYDQKIPPQYYDFAPAPAMGWAGCIQPYVKNTQIFLSPGDPKATGSATYVNGPCSYAMNYNFYGNNFYTGAYQAGNGCISIDHYTYPAERVMVGDWAEGNFGMYDSATDNTVGVPTWFNQGANFGFTDGHCKWLAQASVGPDTLPYSDVNDCHFWTGMDLPGTQ